MRAENSLGKVKTEEKGDPADGKTVFVTWSGMNTEKIIC